jgi:hypothetical protein
MMIIVTKIIPMRTEPPQHPRLALPVVSSVVEVEVST